jgi:hypothetical protein
VLPCLPVDTLLRDDLDSRILDIADELAEQFVADMHTAESEGDLVLALAGLQLHFLSRTARLLSG